MTIQSVPIKDIRVGARFRKEIGDLDDLTASIVRLGLLHPIVVDADHNLIVGMRRLEACRKLGWTEIPAQVVDLSDPLQAESDENKVRKDFTASEAVAIGRAIEDRERKAAKERQATAGPKEGRGHKTGSSKLDEPVKGRSDERTAKAVGLGKDTYRKAKAVHQAAEGDPAHKDLTERMDRPKGDPERLSVDAAHKEMKRRQQEPERKGGWSGDAGNNKVTSTKGEAKPKTPSPAYKPGGGARKPIGLALDPNVAAGELLRYMGAAYVRGLLHALSELLNDKNE